MLTGQILLQLIVILATVQLCGVLCQRIGQQWVVGEILAGLVLGPSLLGSVLPGLEATLFPANALPTLQTFGDVGLIIYMFSLGARLDTQAMLTQHRKAIIASLSSVLLPLLTGATLALFLYPDFAGNRATQFSFLLMVGTAMAITAFPVLARLLVEKQMTNTRVGTLALTCAAIGDVLAWCLLALVIAVIYARGLLSVVVTLACVILFILIMFALVRPLLIWAERRLQSQQLPIVMTMLLLLLSAYLTNAIGIHPVFGAFVMGLILPRKAAFVEQIRRVDLVNDTLFLPIFFAYSGLRTQIGLIHSPALLLLCLLVLLVACIGRLGGGALAALMMRESWREALTFGILMNTRGLVELIVLNIGLDLGVLSPTLFAMLVIMAVVTTMMTSPLLLLFGY
ncbi:MAG TPA: cation:proton antiporter [Ktedonosporobacter sp.]|jgi:Kef-type K+ transport system membrane component KefB|nr:cation:proton antiporter [Ktedonosporobacter sp.]